MCDFLLQPSGFLIFEVKNVLALDIVRHKRYQPKLDERGVYVRVYVYVYGICVWPGHIELHVVSTSSWFYSAGEISILRPSKQCHVIKTCTRDKNGDRTFLKLNV